MHKSKYQTALLIKHGAVNSVVRTVSLNWTFFCFKSIVNTSVSNSTVNTSVFNIAVNTSISDKTGNTSVSNSTENCLI